MFEISLSKSIHTQHTSVNTPQFAVSADNIGCTMYYHNSRQHFVNLLTFEDVLGYLCMRSHRWQPSFRP
jgi:hypothetical protein